MHEAYILIIILVCTLGLFIWGYFRYDLVALLALIALVITGTIPVSATFSGFSNPAVITVACVMVITQTISQLGLLAPLIRHITPLTEHRTMHMATLCVITAILSAFMNNVGALALMMPVAIQTAQLRHMSPAVILMPLAFASVLGGLTTVIGTPPNLLISAYRAQVSGTPFSMFDFSPVGVVVALLCVAFIVLFGWRLLPQREGKKEGEEAYQIHDYITEIRVPSDSKVVGTSLDALEHMVEGDFQVIGLIRGKRKRLVLPKTEILQAKDILIIEATHHDLEKLLHTSKMELVTGSKVSSEQLISDDTQLLEAVVPQGSRMEGRSANSMQLRSRFRMNLIALARQGTAFKKRLNLVSLRPGDVVLLQGDGGTIHESVMQLGLIPLQSGHIQVGKKRNWLPLPIFACAILLAAFQLVAIEVAFTMAVVSFVLLNIIPLRRLYQMVDWPIIVLLGAMIPLGTALDHTGSTYVISNLFMAVAGDLPPFMILALLLVVTMTLSDVMNNAATTVIMAPLAVSIAKALNFEIDPFLMTVALGASCSFLTPISHQNNTLVMGPGGYRFFDYLRLGIPVEIIVLCAGLPTLMVVWPITTQVV